jgi:hypothetical protein
MSLWEKLVENAISIRKNKQCTTASGVQWLEFLATGPEVRLRFPAHPDFLRSIRICNAVHSASWLQLRSYLKEKISVYDLKSGENGRRDPSRSPCGTLYLQKLALISPTNSGHSVSVVRSRTQATEIVVCLFCVWHSRDQRSRRQSVGYNVNVTTPIQYRVSECCTVRVPYLKKQRKSEIEISRSHRFAMHCLFLRILNAFSTNFSNHTNSSETIRTLKLGQIELIQYNV